jgi:hypothetical protein
MLTHPATQSIEQWPIEKLVFYARNPRKNDSAVGRMCSSIREFGFKIPVLARSDGEVVDGHLRLKAARKLGITEVPVILCDERTPAQVKAFRLMVNRSVTWADWDESALALELQELKESDFDLDLTGFDPGEIDNLLALEDDERANATPALPEDPVSRVGDLWVCGKHRVLCGDATSAQLVTRLLGERKPRLMVTDPSYGIERLRMARPRRTERMRPRRGQLHEEAHRGSHRDYHLRRHARRLVRCLRACSNSRGGIRLARQQVHARGLGWLAAHRVRC